jgi:chaperone required for assembly of F1-ATPase
VRLDDKPVRTPAGRLLAAPTLALAEALAAEWEAQRDVIDPAKMPLTRLANSIIDGVSERSAPVAEEVARYLASDLICYRAGSPRGLVERQALHWDPIVEWARDALGARMLLAEGVVHVTQPETALAAAGAAIPGDPWRLGALHSVTTLTGSALLALALARGASPPTKPGRPRMWMKIGTWSNGAATSLRLSAAPTVTPSCRPRRRC